MSEPPQMTAMGYTGHELDAEVGIVNAKGRLFDPKLGRFLQVDPIQTDLFNGQRWNSYSYGRASSQGWRVQWERGPPRQYPDAS